MTETLNLEITKPCANECTRTAAEAGAESVLMGATHGNFCDKEFYAVTSALEQVAEVVEHVVSLIGSKGQGESEVQSSGEVPLPFNTQAFNDANEIYGRLVYWANHWAGVLKRQAPGAAKRTWKTENGRVVGLPYDISPGNARYASSTMAIWLSAHLEDIFWQNPADDVLYFHDEMKDVFRVAARWPFAMQPRFAKIPCPTDGSRLAIHPPKELGDVATISCEGSGHRFTEDEFEDAIRAFKAQQDETVKAAKVAERLARKYAAA
jgi:hypothetical protein